MLAWFVPPVLFIAHALVTCSPAVAADVTPAVTAQLMARLGIPNRAAVWRRGIGPHKTWVSAFAGVAVGASVAGALHLCLTHGLGAGWLAAYRGSAWLPLGLLMGTGAILGDLIKSFVKRRFAIAPSGAWYPWDQTDWVFGAGLLTLPLARIPLAYWFVVLGFALLAHRPVARLFYAAGLKQLPW